MWLPEGLVERNSGLFCTLVKPHTQARERLLGNHFPGWLATMRDVDRAALQVVDRQRRVNTQLLVYGCGHVSS